MVYKKKDPVMFFPQTSPTIEKFVNYVMQDGKKSVARQIFKDLLVILQKSNSQDPVKVFQQAVENVMPVIEVRPKRVGGSVYQVPVEVKYGRQIALAFRWIIAGAKTRKGNSFAKKLADELLEAYENSGNAMKRKEEVKKMAEANKAFAYLAKY